MPDLRDGESTEIQGSGATPYIIKNVGGVYSCSCPAWRNQKVKIDQRTCKHLRKHRGDAAENARLGLAVHPTTTVPTIQSPTEAPPKSITKKPDLLLAQCWDRQLDPTGWWMSEKLDGVRAYWDGAKFLTRNGNVYFAPEWFRYGLPSVPLDGELWMGRKMFQKTCSAVGRMDGGDLWKDVKYLVFDAPTESGAFEARQETLTALIGACGFARKVEQRLALSKEHVLEELARVEALGAEGLMLREPGSTYDPRRSWTLLKVKSFTDAEATITGYQAGKGSLKGMVGSFLCVLDDGTAFKLGSGADAATPPPVGTVVKFKYQNLTDAGVPRFPIYLGVRE